jgi:hypothetical protein
MPPESYDIVAAPAVLPEAQISAPAMFANVAGEITFRGTASGAGFLSYRLQAGQGLNPQNWIQISPDSAQAVTGGILGVWDASKFNGLYAVQLIVIREEQRVDTATIQVTIDNLAPEVSIPYPKPGDRFEQSPDGRLTLQAQASDNIGLEVVEFYIDDQLFFAQRQAPFVAIWPLSAGNHTVRVVAIDLAGNSSEATTQFTVE